MSDFVIAGAGHNSLITACYLVKAGFSCTIIDARNIPGGGCATEEIFGSGYKIDTCSTGHTLMLQNPVISQDELGLVKEFGLSYLHPDPVAHVAFPDGEQITMKLDPKFTACEFARFSKKDSAAYFRLLNEFEELKPMLAKARSQPLGMGPSLRELFLSHPRGGIWLRRQAMSARDVILHEFESKHVRAFMGWMSFQTAVPIDQAGTGLMPYQIVAPRQAKSWCIPKGGSGKLTDALVEYLLKRETRFHLNKKVDNLIFDKGRCVGVSCSDGTEYISTFGVVSTIHIKHLIEMAPEEFWDENFKFCVDTYNVGVPFFASYFATNRPPIFESVHGKVSAVSAGYAGWLDDLVQSGRDIYDGKLSEDISWLLVATPSLVDTSRAPNGHHTVKLLTHTVYDLPNIGAIGWNIYKKEFTKKLIEKIQNFCPSFTEDVILKSITKSPLDIEAWNPHMICGAPHGGDRSITFSGEQRPVPGWSQHRMPIKGLWQTGGTTHPGGSITGYPGRNAAKVILNDLGINPSEILQ